MVDIMADIAALRHAIDDGDDSCLPILADALEDAGDPRASAGLRLIQNKRPLKNPTEREDGVQWEWGWILIHETFTLLAKYTIHKSQAKDLKGHRLAENERYWGCICYHTRSEAFLALAEIIEMEEAK